MLLFLSLFVFNEAFNLRSREQSAVVIEEARSDGEKPPKHTIPDPTCKKGVMSPDMKVCCTDDCGLCGNHDLCSNPGKFHEVTGKLADNCCKNRIAKAKVSCDDNHPPCVLSASYKETIDNYVIQRPKRHAAADCNKAVPVTYSKHANAIAKGDFLSKLYIQGKTKYKE